MKKQKPPSYDELANVLRYAADRGYFDPHPDDSEMEQDEKEQARDLLDKLNS